jgi:hypothetical protein
MKRKDLLTRLRETDDLKGKVPVFKEYLQDLTKEERKAIAKFLPASIQALKKERAVTKAGLSLKEEGYMFGFPYYICHEMACVAAGEPIRSPQTDLQRVGGRKKYKSKYNTGNIRVGKIMANPVKVIVEEKRGSSDYYEE